MTYIVASVYAEDADVGEYQHRTYEEEPVSLLEWEHGGDVTFPTVELAVEAARGMEVPFEFALVVYCPETDSIVWSEVDE